MTGGARLAHKIRFFVSEHFFLLTWLAGIGLYYVGITHIGIYNFAYDPAYHITAIEYMAHTGDRLGRGLPNMKNSFFYICAAAIVRFAESVHWEPWFAVRHFTLFLYLLYLYFALQTIKLTLRTTFVQKLVFAIIIFWPIGFTYPARITPDIGIGMCGMAVFYFLIRWQRTQQDMRLLGYAFFFAGIAILFKTLGYLNLLIIAAAIGITVVMNRRCPRQWASTGLMLPVFFDIFCIWATYNNYAGLHDRFHVASTAGGFRHIASELPVILDFSFWHYLYILVSGHIRNPAVSFWTNLLASLFVGNLEDSNGFRGTSLGLEMTVGILGYAMFIFIACCWLYRVFTSKEKKHFVFFNWLIVLATAIPTLTLLLFRLLVNTWGSVPYADARYMPHFVTFFSILYGCCLEWQLRTGRKRYFRFGVTLAVTFMIASTVLFVTAMNKA